MYYTRGITSAVAVSNDEGMTWTKEKNLELGIGVPSDRIKMIRPGVEYEKFALKRGMMGTAKRKRTVLFVGNFSMDSPTIKTKGVKYLMEAAEILPDVEFTLVGNFKENIEHPENVSMLGVVSPKKLVDLYKKAGVFVCSSLNEGFGLAILEAMSAGCVIVSTIDIGQIGKKIEPKDGKGLAEAIRFYIENPAKTKEDGDKNRKLARTYTWDRFYSGFERLYKSLNKYPNK
jgi:glycosyltransferase involved in cell wall biosynthesis